MPQFDYNGRIRVVRIPTGFLPKAQGCAARATPGGAAIKTQPQRGCGTRSERGHSCPSIATTAPKPTTKVRPARDLIGPRHSCRFKVPQPLAPKHHQAKRSRRMQCGGDWNRRDQTFPERHVLSPSPGGEGRGEGEPSSQFKPTKGSVPSIIAFHPERSADIPVRRLQPPRPNAPPRFAQPTTPSDRGIYSASTSANPSLPNNSRQK